MGRLGFALILAASATTALANSPPPDRFGPCAGLQAGDACYQGGCTCVEVVEGCPTGAASCLSCQNGSAWCGPTNYDGHDDGALGCGTGAPVAASLAGAAWLVVLARRRRR